MTSTTKHLLTIPGYLLVAAILCVTALRAADAKNPIKETMQKYHKAPKGTDPITKKASEGQASKEEIKGMLAAYQAMAKVKPPQGEEASWKEKCAALIKATEALDKGAADGPAQYKAASNCKACHTAHRPDPKK